ncbi:MAG: DUF721 domain-containing protein [Proteobacteria bacterium]|nr:DUF721 domain-containing protein [Pseudomonadota bacterium]
MSDQQPTAEMPVLLPDARPGRGVFAKAVGAFIPKVTSAVFQKFGFHSAEIMASWTTIVGADIARMTRPESIKWPRRAKAATEPTDEGEASTGATLVIATDPAFALDISYRHKEIVDRINRYFGYRAVSQIKVHQTPQLEKPVAVAATSAPGAPMERIAVAPGDLNSALEALGRSVAAARAR